MQFDKFQVGPLQQRLIILQALVQSNKKGPDVFSPEPGTLTIVDLSSEFIDRASACSLFETCMTLFLKDKSHVPKIIALDEAHSVSVF